MSRKLTLLIVDDEELARRLMREYLSKHIDIEIIGECANGLDAVETIITQNPDLILLDILMPKLNGLEVLELTGRTNGVIFTTAYDQHAVKAFELHAVDYLLKPFSQQRFDDALTRARTLLGVGQNPIQTLISDQSKTLTRLVVRDRGQVHIIPVADIDYIEAQDDYINIHWANKSLLKTQSLSELETQLDNQQFIRIHRSFIVRLSAIKCLERSTKDTQVAVLFSGAKLAVSRQGYERIKGVL